MKIWNLRRQERGPCIPHSLQNSAGSRRKEFRMCFRKSGCMRKDTVPLRLFPTAKSNGSNRHAFGSAAGNHALDEPVAGMGRKETDRTGRLLKEISEKCSVIVVEHDMEFVREYADKVTVLHEGRLLDEGNMHKFSKIQSDGSVSGKRR